MNRSHVFLARGLPAVLLLAATSGQTPTRLFTKGGLLPGGNPGEVIDELHVVTSDRSGSVAFLLDTSETPPWGNYLIWGSLDGAPFGVLRRPDPATNGTDSYLSAEIAVERSELAHMPLVGATQQLRIDDRTIWTGGAPTSHASGVWTDRLDDVDLTSTGEPYALASWEDSASGAPLGQGLFFGDPLQPRLISGDIIPGLTGAVTRVMPGAFDLSEDGSHMIGVVQLDCQGCGGWFARFAAVLDGLPVMAGGAPLRGERLVPAALGGAGEEWRSLYDSGITMDGRYFVSGTTARQGQFARAYVLRDGEFWLRSGDPIEAGTWQESRAAVLTEDGLLVHVSTYYDHAGVFQTGLFVEKRPLHLVGDVVDWNGDGSPDAGFVTSSVSTNSRSEDYKAVSDERIYYRAAVTAPSGQVGQGYFVMPYRAGRNYCNALPNSTGMPARMLAYGTADAAANRLSLVANRVPPGSFGYFITGDVQTSVPMAGGSSGVLCVGGSVGRFVGPGQIQSATAGGALSIELDLSDHPQANGSITVTAGQTWNYSAWFRDSTLQGTPTSNFADGVSVPFR